MKIQKWKLTLVKDGVSLGIEEILRGNLSECLITFCRYYNEEMRENGLRRDNIQVEQI